MSTPDWTASETPPRWGRRYPWVSSETPSWRGYSGCPGKSALHFGTHRPHSPLLWPGNAKDTKPFMITVGRVSDSLTRSSFRFRSDLVGYGVDARPSVIDGQLGGVVCLSDYIQVALVILVSFSGHSHQRLAAASDDRLILPVNPR